MRLSTAILSILPAALAGCAGCDDVPAGAVTDCDQQVVPGGAATDILFVVDDSVSMSQEQEELADNLGQFIDALVTSPVRLDVRIGVTNTSIHSGQSATYDTATTYASGPSAGKPYPAGTLVAVVQDTATGLGTAGEFVFDPTGSTTYGGPRILASGSTLVRDFKANVLQGTYGSGKEQPLEAMRLALQKSAVGGVNAGFQRAGARLAVVVLTDEDDCSSPPGDVTSDTDCHNNPGKLTPLSEYVDFLGTTAFADGGAPIFALIAGYDAAATTPSLCQGSSFIPPTTTQANAVPNRLDGFVGQLETASPGRTLKKSICGSFGPSLLQIASMLIPQDLPLQQAPTDWQMMTVALDRGGTTVPCVRAAAGSPGEASADAVFTLSQAGTPVSIHFQNACALGVGDRVNVQIVCVR